MATVENLIPFNKMTEEEQRAIASKGGKASQEARKRRKTLKEELITLLEIGDTQKNMTLSLLTKALDGDIKAYEVVRDTIGEKPSSSFNVSTSNPYGELTDEELKKLIGE